MARKRKEIDEDLNVQDETLTQDVCSEENATESESCGKFKNEDVKEVIKKLKEEILEKKIDVKGKIFECKSGVMEKLNDDKFFKKATIVAWKMSFLALLLSIIALIKSSKD